MFSKRRLLLVGLAILAVFASVLSGGQLLAAESPTTPAPTAALPGRVEVCAIAQTMPGAQATDEFLALLKTDRSQTVRDLAMLQRNMQQYDAEGYGWQNVIDGPSALPPRPGAWLLGALRMACEPTTAD